MRRRRLFVTGSALEPRIRALKMGSAIIPIYNFGNESVAVTLEVRPFTDQNFDMPRRLSNVFVYCQPSGSESMGKVK